MALLIKTNGEAYIKEDFVTFTGTFQRFTLGLGRTDESIDDEYEENEATETELTLKGET